MIRFTTPPKGASKRIAKDKPAKPDAKPTPSPKATKRKGKAEK